MFGNAKQADLDALKRQIDGLTRRLKDLEEKNQRLVSRNPSTMPIQLTPGSTTTIDGLVAQVVERLNTLIAAKAQEVVRQLDPAGLADQLDMDEVHQRLAELLKDSVLAKVDTKALVAGLDFTDLLDRVFNDLDFEAIQNLVAKLLVDKGLPDLDIKAIVAEIAANWLDNTDDESIQEAVADAVTGRLTINIAPAETES